MKDAFRQAMGWLHTWTGLVVGWILFFVFLTGTAGYFRSEIDTWMQPERPLTQAMMPTDEAIALGIARLTAEAPEAQRWFVAIPGYRSPDLRLVWQHPPGPDGKRPANGRADLNAATGEPISYRQTGGGNFLYRTHYRLHYLPLTMAYWIVGICSMFMLVAIVTGVIVHRRIFVDFFTFRFGKGQRSWLDAHNILGVLALPFHVMITWSGLVYFAYLYMTPVIWVSHGVGADVEKVSDAHYDELLGSVEIPTRAGTPASLVTLAPLLRQAEVRFGGGVRSINVHNPGDANARIVLESDPLTLSRARTLLTFAGSTGELLHASPPQSAPVMVWQALFGLHEGLFAGPLLRWLYFLAGVMGTAMIGVGLVHWTAKRRAKIGDTFGFKLVEGLNIGTVVGLCTAIVVYFWANRLIPADLAGRAAWEAHAMFLAWAILLLHAFVRPARRAWIEQFWIAAAACLLLPMLNALTTDRHLGVSLPAGDWMLAGFDLTIFAFGVAFALAAWVLARRQVAEFS
jgi:uncharacterized iron-regulated membrane protein